MNNCRHLRVLLRLAASSPHIAVCIRFNTGYVLPGRPCFYLISKNAHPCKLRSLPVDPFCKIVLSLKLKNQEKGKERKGGKLRGNLPWIPVRLTPRG